MNATVVWLDREHAKLFLFSDVKMERKTVKAGQPLHHTHAHDQLDSQRLERKLFNDVVAQLSDAERILVLGPGMAKHHFQNYLTEHFPSISRKVVGMVDVDHPTDGQIAQLAKEFFWVAQTAT